MYTSTTDIPTDIPNIAFLPDGSYDLSTPERKLAACEAALYYIANTIPTAYHGRGPEFVRDQMMGHAQKLVEKLRLARKPADVERAVERARREGVLRDTVWRRNEQGLLESRTDRHRVLDAAARGLPVPADIVDAAQHLADWAHFTRVDYEATRWVHSGPTWVERIERAAPGWDADPPGWADYDTASRAQLAG